MGCCLALAYLASLVRRTWRSVGPRRLAPVSFAPQARRPAPGLAPGLALVTTSVTTASALSTRPTDPAPAWQPVARGLLAAGLAWFVLGVVGMHLLGWFAWASGSAVTDALFHSSGLWLSAAGAALLIAKA